jgi:GxxExxY protein
MDKFLYKELTETIIGLSIDVHKELGPGLLENTYKQCLAYELEKSNINFQLEVNCPIIYKGVQISCGFRIDLLIENKIVIELKSVEKIIPLHEAQLLTYLKLTNKELGLIINFNEVYLKDGIRRLVLQKPLRPLAVSNEVGG